MNNKFIVSNMNTLVVSYKETLEPLFWADLGCLVFVTFTKQL